MLDVRGWKTNVTLESVVTFLERRDDEEYIYIYIYKEDVYREAKKRKKLHAIEGDERLTGGEKNEGKRK